MDICARFCKLLFKGSVMPIRVFIIDDHPLALNGLEKMLDNVPDISVTGTFLQAEDMIRTLETRPADIILMDIMLPDINGKELLKVVKDRFPAVKILAITSLDAPTYVKFMMQHGASGYLLKNISKPCLAEAIRTAYNGGEYIDPNIKELMVSNMLRFKKNRNMEQETLYDVRLTRREKEVLTLLAKDYTNQQIADELFLSIRTVENHRLNLFRKLDVKTPLGLLRAAIATGLVD